MKSRTYTVKEAVFALNRSGSDEEASRITRHIRHWTSLDLLEPEGAKHTGTGRSREYSPDSVRRAAILLEFSKWRVPMPVLADWFAFFPQEYQEQWDIAVKGTAQVYLMLTWMKLGAAWNLAVDQPNLLFLDDEQIKHDGPYIDEDIEVPASVIVINLTRLLRWVQL